MIPGNAKIKIKGYFLCNSENCIWATDDDIIIGTPYNYHSRNSIAYIMHLNGDHEIIKTVNINNVAEIHFESEV